jgi:HTH-type transcriptional regulator/antitoxin HigA
LSTGPHREFLSRGEEESRLEADIGWLDELPIKEMIRRGCISKSGGAVDTVRQVCRFFGVANRAAWETLWQKPTAYRTSKAFTSNPGAVAAWLRLGERKATEIDCEPFDKAGLSAALDELRKLACQPDPGEWWPKLVRRCASVGVAVVGEPEIKGARINGAARWLAPDKALVQLSLRYHWNDIFWFTLFHEIGHLLIHSKKDAFINDVGSHSGVENEADGFAAQILIPRRYEAELADVVTIQQAKEFAEQIGVAPGVVVGRLQHDSRWPYSKGNNLKQRFVFTS